MEFEEYVCPNCGAMLEIPIRLKVEGYVCSNCGAMLKISKTHKGICTCVGKVTNKELFGDVVKRVT